VKVLTPRQILARLGQQGGQSGVPEALAWSFDLLPPETQALFSQLSVFRGQFGLEDAEAAGARAGLSTNDVLSSLTALVEQSLVLADEEAAGEVRYRLLGAVREFAAERLAQSRPPGPTSLPPGEKRLTYELLQREVRKQLPRQFMLRGPGGPLVFLWSIGLAVCLLWLQAPVFAVVWTAVVIALGGLMMRGSLQEREVQEQLLRAVLDRRFPISELGEPDLQAAAERAKGLFIEIALKLTALERTHGEDFDLRRVVADADGILTLQYEAARQAMEIDRILRIIGAGNPSQEGLKLRAGTAARLRDENIAAIRREAIEARTLANEISQQLDILLLQVMQLDRRAGDMVRTADFARETNATLSRIQAEVDARREAANSVIELVRSGT
jgi:hypothetical protein